MTQMTEKKKPLIILTGRLLSERRLRRLALQKQLEERSFRRIRCRYTGTWILVPRRFCRKR